MSSAGDDVFELSSDEGSSASVALLDDVSELSASERASLERLVAAERRRTPVSFVADMLLVRIFVLLDATDVCVCCCVSQRWNRLGSLDLVWQRLCARRGWTALNERTWRDQYRLFFTTPAAIARALKPSGARTRNDFELGATLGEGAYGEVVQATEVATGVKYAIKVIDKAKIKRDKLTETVMRERNILAKLGDHPHILQLFWTFQDRRTLYFVLELCPFGDLHTRVSRDGALDVRTAAQLTSQILSALLYMHERGVLHRDVKPENCLFAAPDQLRLSDFGTAKESGPGSLMRSSSFVGTLEYMAVEMVNSHSASPESDLWSFGVLLYFVLTQRLPFRGQSSLDTMQLISSLVYTIPPSMPAAGADIVRSLLHSEASRRLGAASNHAELRGHPFFAGVSWPRTPSAAATSSVPVLVGSESSFSIAYSPSCDTLAAMQPPRQEAAATAPAAEASPPPAAGLPRARSGADIVRDRFVVSGPERTRRIDLQKASVWNRFLRPNELIVKSSLVAQKKGIRTTKQQLILTDMPRLLSVDVKAMTAIDLGPQNPSKCSLVVRDKKKFTVSGADGVTLMLEDVQEGSDPKDWVAAIIALFMNEG